jgi:hypothetical protein
MIARNLPAVETIPDVVRGRIATAAELQSTRRGIARTLGTWYVADERREPGRQAARDRAAAAAREWRSVALEHGHNPAPVRRSVLQNLAS